MQRPAKHVSFCVQRFPSSHGVPIGASGCVHIPVDGSHTPAWWHWLSAVQMIGFAPTHTPARQASVRVQGLPSSHAVPSGLGVPLHTPVAGLQVPAF
jgi:hypothetical protein